MASETTIAGVTTASMASETSIAGVTTASMASETSIAGVTTANMASETAIAGVTTANMASETQGEGGNENESRRLAARKARDGPPPHHHRRLQTTASVAAVVSVESSLPETLGPFGQLQMEGATHYAINKQFIFDVVEESVKASSMNAEELTAMSSITNKGPTALGVTIDCSSSLSLTECIVVCTPENQGLMEVGVAEFFEIGGEKVAGPFDTEVFFVDGVCDDLILLTTSDPEPLSTREPVGTTNGIVNPSGLCYSEGFNYEEGNTTPFDTISDISADECLAYCEANTVCIGFNFVGPTCHLKQNSVDIDIFFSQGQSLCQDNCVNDSECHTSEFAVSICKMYDVAMSKMIAYGPGTVSSAGPVPCALKGENVTLVPVPSLDTPSPNYEANKNAAGLNTITIDDFLIYPVIPAGQTCAEGFTEVGNKCLKVFPHRLSLEDARRTCSYLNSTLYNPTLDSMNKLCDANAVDCSSNTRNSFYWSRLTLSANDEILDYGMLATADVPVGEPLAGQVTECVYADFTSKKLIPSTCGAYCVSPATDLSIEAGSSLCGVDGRYAITRKPFICEQNNTDNLNLVIDRRISYIDDTGTQRCATMGSDIVGNDLWNTSDWAEPINHWHECEGICRGIAECEAFTYVAPSCSMMKEEKKKQNPPSLVFTEATRLTSLLNIEEPIGQDECNARCMQDPECNNSIVFKPGICYIKGAATPVKDTLNWIPVISGPTSCTEEVDPIVPVTSECPVGYFYASEGEESICVSIMLNRTTAVEAHRTCVKTGGVLASPKTEIQNELILDVFCPEKTIESCRLPRGDGALDGVFYFGLGSTRTGINNTWHWVDGSKLEYTAKFGGQPGNPSLVFNSWPTIQPDNTSGNQMCSYYYPVDSPAALNGGWGDEDCEFDCLLPPSPFQVMTHAPECMGGAGREMHFGRRFVCTAEAVE